MTKLYRFVPTLLILLGFILVGKSTYYYGKGKLASILLEKAWERTKSEKTVQNPWEWADTHPVGDGGQPKGIIFSPLRGVVETGVGLSGGLS